MKKLALFCVLLAVSCSSTPDPKAEKNQPPLPKFSTPLPIYNYPDREHCWSGEIVAELSECPTEPTAVSFRIVTSGNNYGTIEVWMNADNILGQMKLDMPNASPPTNYELRRNLYRIDNQTQRARYNIIYSFPAPVVGTDELRTAVGSSILETDNNGNALLSQTQTYSATKHDPFLRCVINAVRQHIMSGAAPLDLVTNCEFPSNPFVTPDKIVL